MDFHTQPSEKGELVWVWLPKSESTEEWKPKILKLIEEVKEEAREVKKANQSQNGEVIQDHRLDALCNLDLEQCLSNVTWDYLTNDKNSGAMSEKLNNLRTELAYAHYRIFTVGRRAKTTEGKGYKEKTRLLLKFMRLAIEKKEIIPAKKEVPENAEVTKKKKELTTLLRGIIDQVGKTSPRMLGEIRRIVRPLKAFGIVPGVHVGRTDFIPGSYEILEWYAGQLLYIVITEQWFAMNGYLNNKDRFAPEIK